MIKKYLLLLGAAALMAGCHSSGNSPKNTEAMTAASVAGAAAENSPERADFAAFAAKFETTSLPYSLDTSKIVNNYEEEAWASKRLIDKELVKKYLSDSVKLESIWYLAGNYTAEKDKKAVTPEAGEEAQSRTYFYYLSAPVRTEKFTGLVIGCYDSGLEMCGSGTFGYALLCTFTPEGKLISSAVLAENSTGFDAPAYGHSVTGGTISADYLMNTKTVDVQGEMTEEEEKPNEIVTHSAAKYKIEPTGVIVTLSKK